MGLRILTPPTCVGLRYGHATRVTPTRLFLAPGVSDFTALRAFVPRFGVGEWICLLTHLYAFNRYAITGLAYPGVSPHSTRRWFRNLDRISIAYAFRPRLRNRLTLRRLSLLRKPWTYGEKVFHLLYRY